MIPVVLWTYDGWATGQPLAGEARSQSCETRSRQKPALARLITGCRCASLAWSTSWSTFGFMYALFRASARLAELAAHGLQVARPRIFPLLGGGHGAGVGVAAGQVMVVRLQAALRMPSMMTGDRRGVFFFEMGRTRGGSSLCRGGGVSRVVSTDRKVAILGGLGHRAAVVAHLRARRTT